MAIHRPEDRRKDQAKTAASLMDATQKQAFHAIMFSESLFDPEDAERWLKSNGFPEVKVEIDKMFGLIAQVFPRSECAQSTSSTHVMDKGVWGVRCNRKR